MHIPEIGCVPHIRRQMVRVFDPSFGEYHQAIIDHAVGGGIVCSLGDQSLRALLADISITLKPQQDIIVQALDELRRNTEVAMAALEESGSPYKHEVVRNLRTHHAAYVTFTKVIRIRSHAPPLCAFFSMLVLCVTLVVFLREDLDKCVRHVGRILHCTRSETARLVTLFSSSGVVDENYRAAECMVVRFTQVQSSEMLYLRAMGT